MYIFEYMQMNSSWEFPYSSIGESSTHYMGRGMTSELLSAYWNICNAVSTDLKLPFAPGKLISAVWKMAEIPGELYMEIINPNKLPISFVTASGLAHTQLSGK